MVVFEPRSPVRCPEEGLQGAGQVHEHVAHQEEHTRQQHFLSPILSASFIDILRKLVFVVQDNKKKRPSPPPSHGLTLKLLYPGKPSFCYIDKCKIYQFS